MSEWNAMTFEGKDTILKVVDEEAQKLFAMAEVPENWDTPTPCDLWSVGDVVAHIVDTTEGYFAAFDAADGKGSVPEPHGLLVMSELANAGAKRFSDLPQAEMVQRLRDDHARMQSILQPLSAEDWSGKMVTHAYMGPVPAFLYAGGQLMDYGVHGWDVREGIGQAQALRSEVADLLAPFMFEIWRGTVKADESRETYTVGIRISGRNAGDTRVTLSSEGMSYEPGDIESLPSWIEFDAGSFVLTTFGRISGGTVHGDEATAQRFLGSFFRI
jgi:uncharacterized protein (TIGR03083 family)